MIRRGTLVISGVLFAVGLALGGMTQPEKILGFLDIFGAWDPSLLFVMLGAVGVHSIAYRLTMRRASPVFAESFHVPRRQELDARLIGGATLFGIGWGLAGYCPGPALVAASAFVSDAAILSASMFGGYLLFGWVQQWSERRSESASQRLPSKAAQGA